MRAISLKAGCCKQTLRFWMHPHKQEFSAKSIPPSGRSLLLDQCARRRAVELLAEGVDGGARFVARALRSEGSTHAAVSAGTLLQGPKFQSREDGDELFFRRGRPPNASSSVNKSQRVSFATASKNMRWSRPMISDRCKLALRYPGCVVRSVRWKKTSLRLTKTQPTNRTGKCLRGCYTLRHHQIALCDRQNWAEE